MRFELTALLTEGWGKAFGGTVGGRRWMRAAFPLNEAAEMGGSPKVANGACRGVSLAFEVTCERSDVWSTALLA